MSVPARLGALTGATAPSTLTLTATILTEPSHGTLSTTLAPDGSFGYTPDSGWVGTDTFTYEVSDGTAEAVATASIQTYESLSSSTDFDAVASGDFNNDGNADIVAINNNGTVSSAWIFMGNGQGGFGSPTTYNVGSSPVAVAVGDLGNGAQDIVVLDQSDARVYFLMNYGNGSFSDSYYLNVGPDPTALALGDFTGNGLLDLAVTNGSSGGMTYANTVSVYLNNGTGTYSNGGSGAFSLQTTVAVGTSPSSVAAADLNGDGMADLVVANAGDATISVLLSTGGGNFATQTIYSVGSSPSAVVAADFTGSGIIDVAVANYGSGTVSVLMNNGNGVLTPSQTLTVGSGPIALSVAKIEGTGYIDLLVANETADNETVLANNADGSGAFTVLRQTMATEADVTGVAVFNVGGNLYEVLDAAPVATKISAPMAQGWKVMRNPREGHALVESLDPNKDTFASLAKEIGLQPNQVATWLTWEQPGTAKLTGEQNAQIAKMLANPNMTVAQVFPNQTRFWVPNQVIAYWGGEGASAGRYWVKWNADLDAVQSKNYNVLYSGYKTNAVVAIRSPNEKPGDTPEQLQAAYRDWQIRYNNAVWQAAQKGGWQDDPLTAQAFLNNIKTGTMNKSLYGVLLWGHGGPSGVLLNANANNAKQGADYFVTYDMWQKTESYKLGLGILYACFTEEANTKAKIEAGTNVFAANGIFWGSNGTLVPPLCPPAVQNVLRSFDALKLGFGTGKPPSVSHILDTFKGVQ